MKQFFILTVLVFFLADGFTQKINQDILQKKWNANWITGKENAGEALSIIDFRKKFKIEKKPSSFIIHVSADSRYKLFVNGELVSLGPARSDLYHWNFETVDIATQLVQGDNLVHAIVWNFNAANPEAQISYRTAFILQGNNKEEEILNTGKTWECKNNSAYSLLTPDLIYTYYVAGPGLHIDNNKITNPIKDSIGWVSPNVLSAGLPKGVFDWSDGWMLVPREIPPMEMKTERLKSVKKVTGVVLPEGFPAEKKTLTIPANTKAILLIDQGYLTNAYPVMKFSGGKAAKVKIGYTEALYIDEGNNKPWKAQHQKGQRDDTENKRFVGVKDEIISNGTQSQEFTTLIWRTWRYMQLEIETAEENLVIDDLYSVFTGYPFVRKATLNFEDENVNRIFDVGWRTARLCAVETYMDCPYYEQLQYIGDTRIQALISLYNSGDDRLVRQAISQIDNSRMAEGLTLSRFPTAHAQEIPPFSLWWIGMLHDFYMYRGDEQFLKKFIPGMRQVLSFFSRYQLEDGSLVKAPYWNFTDWCEAPGWDRGVGPKSSSGTSAMLDMQLLLAYQHAIVLEKALGNAGMADQYLNSAKLLENTIRKKYWQNEKKLFADTEEKGHYSQHTNTFALLTGMTSGNEAAALAEKILKDTTLSQATIYFKYYVHQALAKAGKGNEYMNWLEVWKQNLEQGMTTWAEISDINNTRSDCHAWGASPNIEFFRIVLGIDSDAPGFRKVKITPQPGPYKKLKGSMPHPAGTISADYSINGNSITANLELPDGISGNFIWNKKVYALKPGKNRVEAR